MKRRFRLAIPESMIADRQMTREVYKQIMQWLRTTTRAIEKAINWDKLDKHLIDTIVYGTSTIAYKDLLI